MKMKQEYNGHIQTIFWIFIPFVLYVSKSIIDNTVTTYALHITPFFEIGVNKLNKFGS